MKSSTVRALIALSVLPILAIGCGKKKTAATTVASTAASAASVPADTGTGAAPTTIAPVGSPVATTAGRY